MDGEMFRLVQTLNDFSGPVSIAEMVAKSGLSRGKVLGNLPKLCVEGLVDKHGRQYAITRRGRAILREVEPVPENKGFYFYQREGMYLGLVARSLKEFYETIKTVDLKSLEFHTQRRDFENWIREVLHDEELASEAAKFGSSSLSGKTLRDRLCEAVGRNYRMLQTLMT